MIEARSSMEFSRGVPVSAQDRSRGSALQAALTEVARFLIFCASSMIATPHVLRRGPQSRSCVRSERSDS